MYPNIHLRPIYHNRVATTSINSNNHYEYAPYIAREKEGGEGTAFVEVDREWWETMVTDRTKKELRKRCEVVVGDVTVPHTNQIDDWENAKQDPSTAQKLWWEFYAGYIHQFDEGWNDTAITMETVSLNTFDLQNLTAISEKKLISKIDLTDEEERYYTQLTERIDAAQKNLGMEKMFMKLSCTSGKNDPTYEPDFFSLGRPRQVTLQLTKNYEFLKAYQKCLRYSGLYDISVVLKPWEERLVPENEFRVFVCKSKVTALSQQQWYKPFYHTPETLSDIVRAVVELHGCIASSLPLPSVMLDVWVDLTATPFEAHLIECNSWGASFASGSSLFHWVADYDKLHNTDGDVHVNYLAL